MHKKQRFHKILTLLNYLTTQIWTEKQVLNPFLKIINVNIKYPSDQMAPNRDIC